MKAASIIAKQPVVGVNEGEQIAIVKHLLTNRKTKKVEYLSVESSNTGIVLCVLPFRDILGIGKDYIVVQSSEKIKNAPENPNVVAAAEECLLLNGTIVASSGGDVIDTIADYIVDEKTGDITQLLLSNGGEIDGDKILTLSAKFVFVDMEGTMDSVRKAADAELALDDGTVAYLLGKTVNSDVTSDDGGFTVQKGTVLTRELIAEAERHDALLLLTLEV